MVERSGRTSVLHDRVYDFELGPGETVTFTKTLSVCTSLQCRVGALKEETLRLLNEAVSKGFERNLSEHTSKWKGRWDHANITIRGDEACDKALRLNIYHLIIAGFKGNFPMSIGARALTGQGYRGHVFWDSDIFMLPFYIYTDPVVAKNMLLYRYYRLNAARKNARERGYNGVLFPWESASGGDDVTPRYARDIDGSVIKIDTIDFEHHVSADVAYAVFNYYRATQDTEFMTHHGAEIIFETARFWSSRATFDKKKKKYEIRDVIGPDEFHVHVNNDVYTNIMAAWNMGYAADLYDEIKEKDIEAFGRLRHKLRISDDEAADWRHISGHIYVPNTKRDGIIEQFEGYFKKKDIVVRNYDNNFMPEAPSHFSYSDFNKTKFIKQPDTLLVFQLLPERFSDNEKKKSLRYYMKYTLHQSSLSHSSHAIVSSRLGNILRAYVLFLFSSQVDLKNLHNNTDGGMHMANAGGTWQAAVFGFAGVSFDKDGIAVNPSLPSHWKGIDFNLFWKKCFLKFSLENYKANITYYPINSGLENITLRVFGDRYTLEPFKTLEVKRKGGRIDMKRVRDIIKKENFIYASENTPVMRVSRLLVENKVSSVPIINDDNELKGIISEQDILRVTESKKLAKLKAKDVMNKNVEYVKDDDHLEIAIRLFAERPYRRLPVLRGKAVVGVISRREVLSSCMGEYY
jgi:kojibiose phosphorylase